MIKQETRRSSKRWSFSQYDEGAGALIDNVQLDHTQTSAHYDRTRLLNWVMPQMMHVYIHIVTSVGSADLEEFLNQRLT